MLSSEGRERHDVSESISISEAFLLYRQVHIVMSHQSQKTEEGYIGAGKLLVRLFGDIDICTLTFENVREWHFWLSGWQAPDTVRGNIICLRMVLKFLAIRGFEVINYDSIIVAKRSKRKVGFLTEEEMDEFIKEAARPVRGYCRMNRLRNVAVITLLFATGMRNSEICALNRGDIRNRSFTVIGKSRDPRIVFINDRAETALNEYLSARDDNNKAMFISHQNGNRMTSKTLRLVFSSITNRSNFERVHPHMVRHSFATKQLDKGVDIIYVGDLMGHVDLNTTKIYTHYANKKLREIYEAANN